ncbi:protein lin1 [Holotrichia oblita]|uniref:Protein lin1 n=1 Tax=Holotrichia oblita TaxID=644536 RepID=A0ACB9SI09_HOLOL|nr:protein lin1 [Holotrichia oblita]
MITVIFLTLFIVENVQCDIFLNFGAYRKECIDDLNIDTEPLKKYEHFLVTNSQMRDLQCLDRCVLIKCGIIDENETLQVTTLREQLPDFPKLNASTNLNEICPIFQNITDKCEKGYLIGKCIQYQMVRRLIQHQQVFQSHFQGMPPRKWRKYRSECLREVNATNSNEIASFEIGFCTHRCMLIKAGIIDENNTIQEGKIKELVGNGHNADVRKCGISSKNEDKCKEAMNIKRCLNRIAPIHKTKIAMFKRKFDDFASPNDIQRKNARRKGKDDGKKHSLDSDEEDYDDEEDNVLDENEIEGEEDGNIPEGEIRMTAFNMQEEMELGHFDKQGHFIWKNEKEVRDNWLDNIDWQQIKSNAKISDDYMKGLGEDSDSDDEIFDEIKIYKQIITYMKPAETISKALRRLGGNTEKLSSIERLKRKKAGTLNSNKEVIELTELADKILTNLGNMDVYQETYEQITQKIENHNKKNKSKKPAAEPELDMYSDNFANEEKAKLGDTTTEGESVESTSTDKKLMWEFKWDQNKDKVEGPYTTEQMNKWANEGYFKTGVWVRKCGENTNFYTSNRIDFDLYL